nr:hypothetical protein [Tanacetum cinerariifolium]
MSNNTLATQASCPGGNNAKASSSASRKAQQTDAAVFQDCSGVSVVGVVIGLSAADSQGGTGGSQGFPPSQGITFKLINSQSCLKSIFTTHNIEDLLHVRDSILHINESCRLLKGMRLLLVKAFKPRVNSNWCGISTSIGRSRSSTELFADLLANPGKHSLTCETWVTEVCQSMVDQLAPSGFFSQLQCTGYEQLFAESNVGITRQACFCVEKDVEIANLKAQVSLKEAEVTEAICLRGQVAIVEGKKGILKGQVATLEFAASAKEAECTSLTTQTPKLTQDLSSLQLCFDELNVKAASFDRGLRLTIMKCLQSPEYVAALGATIGLAIDKGMQTGLATRIDHGKAGRGLTEVVSYDPSVEGKYVFMVLAFHNLEFTLISQLESQKDTRIADITSLLYLEGPSPKTPKGIRLQTSYEQLLFPIHRTEDNVVIEETSLSDSLDLVHAQVWKIKEGASSCHLSIYDVIGPLVYPLSPENLFGEASTSRVPATVAVTNALSTTFAHTSFVPPISVSDYEVLDAKPQPEASHSPKIIFEQETLETLPEHPAID